MCVESGESLSAVLCVRCTQRLSSSEWQHLAERDEIRCYCWKCELSHTLSHAHIRTRDEGTYNNIMDDVPHLYTGIQIGIRSLPATPNENYKFIAAATTTIYSRELRCWFLQFFFSLRSHSLLLCMHSIGMNDIPTTRALLFFPRATECNKWTVLNANCTQTTINYHTSDWVGGCSDFSSSSADAQAHTHTHTYIELGFARS